MFLNNPTDKLRILLGSKVHSTKENLGEKFSVSLKFYHHPQTFSKKVVTLTLSILKGWSQRQPFCKYPGQPICPTSVAQVLDTSQKGSSPCRRPLSFLPAWVLQNFIKVYAGSLAHLGEPQQVSRERLSGETPPIG